MSCTEIYAFGKAGTIIDEAYIKNAWLGAYSIWRILEERHLPSLPKPPWAFKKANYYYRTDQTHNVKGMEEIWRLFSNTNFLLTKNEVIVLGSTFDYVLIEGSKLDELCLAFETFDDKTNLKSQAEAIKKMIKSNTDNITAIGFNQTSVSDPWCRGYNYITGKDHWWLFKEIYKNQTEK